jgi:hypothetical protein
MPGLDPAIQREAHLRAPSFVMAGLVPAIHVFDAGTAQKSWMPATSAGMTVEGGEAKLIPARGTSLKLRTTSSTEGRFHEAS